MRRWITYYEKDGSVYVGGVIISPSWEIAEKLAWIEGVILGGELVEIHQNGKVINYENLN